MCSVNVHVYLFLYAVVSKSTEVVHRSTSETKPLADVKERPRVELPGLTWVRTEARAVEVDTCA